VVAVHRIGDEELVTAFEAERGGTLWEHRRPTSFVCGSHYTSGPYSTPAIADGRVITLGAQGRLECLDLESGRLHWSRETGTGFDVPTEVFGAGHSPRVWRGLAILNIGGRTPESGIVAFDIQTGEVRWQATAHGASFATPVLATLHGRERAIVLTADALVVLDPADGRVIAEFPCASNVPDGESAVTPVVAEDLILVSIFGYGTVCLRVQPDESLVTVWEDRRALTSQYNPLLHSGGCVYGVHATDKSFRCLELRSGRVKWRWKSPLGRSTHLIAGDQILLYGEFGELGAIRLNAEECVPTAVVTSTVFDGQRCFSAPALAAGRLYLRNENTLVCLDLRRR
jgi:outer membrane protein assembly factor BamB